MTFPSKHCTTRHHSQKYFGTECDCTTLLPKSYVKNLIETPYVSFHIFKYLLQIFAADIETFIQPRYLYFESRLSEQDIRSIYRQHWYPTSHFIRCCKRFLVFCQWDEMLIGVIHLHSLYCQFPLSQWPMSHVTWMYLPRPFSHLWSRQTQR